MRMTEEEVTEINKVTKNNIRNIIAWIMIIGIISLGVYAVYWINTESFECVSNPYSYSMNLLEEANNAPVSAILSVHNQNGISVLWTKDGFENIEVLEPEKNSYNFDFKRLDKLLEK